MKSLKDGLLYHLQVIKSGFTPTIFTSNQLIHLYSKNSLLREAHKLFDEMPERNVFSWNAIISGYIKSQNLVKARELFDAAPQKDLVTYNSMLSGYVNSDEHESEARAIELFIEMQSSNDRKDEFTLTTMLNLIAKLSIVSFGMLLHSFMVKTANDLTGFAVSSLVDMYSKCGCFKEAFNVFHISTGFVDLVSKNAIVAACCREGKLDLALSILKKYPELNDVISWNTLILGHVQNGYEEESLKLFVQMAENGFKWNEHTFASVLGACSGLKSLKLGKEVHAKVLKDGFILNPFISSGIVDVYCKCNNMRYAELVNDSMRTINSFSITSLIVGHSSQGNLVEARKLFDSLACKNSVVWTSLISGYVKSRQCDAVFELLREYQDKEEMIVSDSLILMSIVSACAIQADLTSGKQIHAYLLRLETKMDKKLISCLIDMYSKCGCISYAKKFFERVVDRDLIIYNVMISGFARHGNENEAIQLFGEMLENGMKPDEITFIAILSACRHSGLVKEGENFFYSMNKEYNITPEIDHYSCMIDLYGRACELEKAEAFMRKIPIELDAVIWGAFLNACKMNGNMKLAREAEERIFEIERENGSRYVQLANFYAAERNWEEMGRIRKRMRGEVKKSAGCSWVYLENKVHVFISGDRCHSKTEAIYSLLACLTEELYEIAGSFRKCHTFRCQLADKNDSECI